VLLWGGGQWCPGEDMGSARENFFTWSSAGIPMHTDQYNHVKSCTNQYMANFRNHIKSRIITYKTVWDFFIEDETEIFQKKNTKFCRANLFCSFSQPLGPKESKTGTFLVQIVRGVELSLVKANQYNHV